MSLQSLIDKNTTDEETGIELVQPEEVQDDELRESLELLIERDSPLANAARNALELL